MQGAKRADALPPGNGLGEVDARDSLEATVFLKFFEGIQEWSTGCSVEDGVGFAQGRGKIAVVHCCELCSADKDVAQSFLVFLILHFLKAIEKNLCGNDGIGEACKAHGDYCCVLVVSVSERTLANTYKNAISDQEALCHVGVKRKILAV